MSNTNVELSQTELEIVSNADFLLTKNKIIAKVYGLFGILSKDYTEEIEKVKNFMPSEILKMPPKIYKGEQYEGLPYVMMDYPRCFLKEDVFAVRSFFWWGNFFSITLHVSGKYQQLFYRNIFAWVEKYKSDDWSLCISADAWQHHFGAEYYEPVNTMLKNKLFEDDIEYMPFVKLAKKIPLQQWQCAIDFFLNNYRLLLEIVRP